MFNHLKNLHPDEFKCHQCVGNFPAICAILSTYIVENRCRHKSPVFASCGLCFCLFLYRGDWCSLRFDDNIYTFEWQTSSAAEPWHSWSELEDEHWRKCKRCCFKAISAAHMLAACTPLTPAAACRQQPATIPQDVLRSCCTSGDRLVLKWRRHCMTLNTLLSNYAKPEFTLSLKNKRKEKEKEGRDYIF